MGEKEMLLMPLEMDKGLLVGGEEEMVAAIWAW